MMLHRTGPAVRVPLIDRRSRSVRAGRHHGDVERVCPTRGPHLLLLLLLCACGLYSVGIVWAYCVNNAHTQCIYCLSEVCTYSVHAALYCVCVMRVLCVHVSCIWCVCCVYAACVPRAHPCLEVCMLRVYCVFVLRIGGRCSTCTRGASPTGT